MDMSIFTGKSPSSFVALFFTPIIYSVLIPFGITLWVANESLRWIVGVLLWFKYGPGLRLVNDSHDAIFSSQSTGNSRNVLVVGITEKNTVNLSKFRKHFETRVLLHEETAKASKYFLETKRYRPYAKLEKIMVSVMGYACWKNDINFDIKNHFRLAEDKVYDENNLMELLSLLSEDMGAERPQWEWIFIARYQDATGKEKSVQIFRYHHAYMDELSLQFMLSTQLGDKNVKLSFNPKDIRPENWKKLILYVNTLVYGPFVLLQMLLQKFGPHWISPPSNLDSTRELNFVTTSPITVKVFERIRAQTNASIPNTIAKAFITSVRNVLPKDRLLQTVRISETIAVLPFNNSNPQNRSSVFSYDIDTQEAQENPQDFCDSVAKLRRNRLGEMASPQQILFFYILSYLFTLPSFFLKYFAHQVYSSVTLRNIPSFSEKVSLFNTDVEELSIYPPLNYRAGISLASTSYNGYLKLTLTANSSWLTQEDLQRIIIAMPKVIFAIEEKGYIPSELQELPSSNLIIDSSKLHGTEMEDEVSLRGSSASSDDTTFQENDTLGKKLPEVENQEDLSTNAGDAIIIQEQFESETLKISVDESHQVDLSKTTEGAKNLSSDKISNLEKAPSSIPVKDTHNSTLKSDGWSEKRRTETNKPNKTGKARAKNGKR